MNHITLICNNCKVLEVRGDWAVWYEDGGFKYADVYDCAEGWVSYSCNSAEEFDLFCDGAGEEEDDFPDDVDECGYDPYMGCYTWDC